MGIIKKKIEKGTKKLETMDALQKLKKDLQALGPIPSGKEVYNYGVKFFNIIASFQDNYAVEAEMFKDTNEETRILVKHINNAGRDLYGIVRAKRGEPVTLHNLYLGNIYGLVTYPAAFWQDQPEKDIQQIIQGQLSGFIKSHREPMIELITKVLKDNKKPNGLLVKAAYKRKLKGKTK